MIRFASLGSGSRGNALIVEAGGSRILLDCGFGARETCLRLARLGLAPEDLDGVLVTHEHGDHIGGAFKFAARHALRVHLTYGTLSAAPAGRRPKPALSVIDSHVPFAIGGIEVLPYPVPHDAREPVQFVFSDGVHRLGVLTDAGGATPHIEAMLSGCHALVLECNHDREMLATGPYSPALKARIGGRYGHLANDQAAALLAALDRSRLRHVIAAHLSEQNNTPRKARAALAAAFGSDPEWIGLATQETGFAWREVR